MSASALAIGLQEWAACCRALAGGRLLLAVRKGGIHERHGGLFAPEHERFALLPTRLHQDVKRLREPFRTDLDAGDAAPTGFIGVAAWAQVHRVWKATDLDRVLALGEELAWTADELAARFRYREQPFLFVLALRVWRLPTRQDIADLPAYAGCRSWIPLRDSVDTAASIPAIADDLFATRLARVARTLDQP
jgi:hypothetical protein